MSVLEVCGKEKYFNYFEQICSIPHGSGNTKAISDWCVCFAEEHNLRSIQDDYGNVIIYKDASKGFENHKPVIIQGHLDMVCVHEENYQIDMKTIPVKVQTDGHFIWADRTSLGGDNGSGVSVALAVLADDSLVHPPLEVVLTSDEETGMIGAQALDFSKLSGRKLINLDYSPYGTFVVNCAGGIQVNCILPLNFENKQNLCYKTITLEEFSGGHSGNLINTGRTSSNYICCQLLNKINSIVPLWICSVCGGQGENAIPTSTSFTVGFDKCSEEEFTKLITSLFEQFKTTYSTTDPMMKMTITSSEEKKVAKESDTVIKHLKEIPFGVLKWDERFESLPQTSLNMGILKVTENFLEYHHYIRSSKNEEKTKLSEKLCTDITALGGTFTTSGCYSGWDYDKNSKLREKAVEVYEKFSGEKANITTTHAGLECGIFSEGLHGVDIISTGATQIDIHTAKEKLDVQSMRNLFAFTTKLLQEL